MPSKGLLVRELNDVTGAGVELTAVAGGLIFVSPRR